MHLNDWYMHMYMSNKEIKTQDLAKPNFCQGEKKNFHLTHDSHYTLTIIIFT